MGGTFTSKRQETVAVVSTQRGSSVCSHLEDFLKNVQVTVLHKLWEESSQTGSSGLKMTSKK